MAENNFALIIVAVVAVVAVVGILNLNGMTGKVGTNVVQTSGEKELYVSEWECGGCNSDGTNCKYSCSSFLTETTDPSTSNFNFWKCGEKLEKYCHKFYYRTG